MMSSLPLVFSPVGKHPMLSFCIEYLAVVSTLHILQAVLATSKQPGSSAACSPSRWLHTRATSYVQLIKLIHDGMIAWHEMKA